jgi:predicted ATPase
VALSFKERRIDGRLGEPNVSDGVIHALALLVAIEVSQERTTNPDVLIIEEPENALHPWALHKIVEDAQELPRPEPLLFTTHSPVLVNAVKAPESLYIVENDEQKGTLAFPAEEKEHALRAILAASGQKLGDLWLDGSLGGVPGVGV